MDSASLFVAFCARRIQEMASLRDAYTTAAVDCGQAKVEIDGQDVGTLIQAIDAQYPGVADKLLDDDGNIKRFINVFVNDAEVRSSKVCIHPCMLPIRFRSFLPWPVDRIAFRIGRSNDVTPKPRSTGATCQKGNYRNYRRA